MKTVQQAPAHLLITTVSSIVRLLRQKAEHGMEQYELGHPEQMALMCLYPDRTCNQDAVANMLDVDKGAVARTMAKLERKKLIVRVPNPSNRRENLVSLDSSSAEVLEIMKTSLDSCTEAAFKGFTQEERDATLLALDRIVENLREG